MRTIHLAATGRTVTLGNYVRAIRTAKANPGKTFKHGLNTWWSVTGAEVVTEFREAMHQRINDGISYRARR